MSLCQIGQDLLRFCDAKDTKKDPKLLDGYLALNDGIIHLILNEVLPMEFKSY